MFSRRESRTKLIVMAVVVLGSVLVTVWGGLLLVSSHKTSLPPTRVVTVMTVQVVTPTVVFTPVTVGTPSLTEIAIAATQQAKFNDERIQYPTLPPGSTSKTYTYSFSPVAWLGTLGIIVALLILTSLALRAQLRSRQ